VFSPMPLLALFICAGYLLAVLKTVTAALDAPIGYEDENGFHLGMVSFAQVQDN
jgi:hypothetical protein